MGNCFSCWTANGKGPQLPPVVLFQSHQQTGGAYNEWHRWLRGREPESLKVSLPPFNVPKTITLLPMTKSYNVPTFGVMIPKAIMPLFESEEIKAMAKELNIRIPKYMLDVFVQTKMFKVKILAQAARDLGGWEEQADRLERFATAFENLAVAEVPGPDEWKRFVEQHVAEGWESRLHFDHVLQNFGFDDDAAKQLRGTKYAETDGKTGEVTTHDLETFSFRWLGKAFSGYSVKGCLTDVVNLVFAMAELDDDGTDPKDLLESQIADKITAVVTKVNRGDLSGLWVPTHIVHDSESDDLLCWLLLEQIHKTLGSDLQVLVQFPPVRRAAARTSPEPLATHSCCPHVYSRAPPTFKGTLMRCRPGRTSRTSATATRRTRGRCAMRSACRCRSDLSQGRREGQAARGQERVWCLQFRYAYGLGRGVVFGALCVRGFCVMDAFGLGLALVNLRLTCMTINLLSPMLSRLSSPRGVVDKAVALHTLRGRRGTLLKQI